MRIFLIALAAALSLAASNSTLLPDFDVIKVGEYQELSMELMTVKPVYLLNENIKPSRFFQVVASFEGAVSSSSLLDRFRAQDLL